MTASYKLLNNVIGWVVFLIAAVAYVSCIEPTASFWDCGEYVACSYKLEVGHPPGAPTFLLLGRFFSLFAGSKEMVAASINVLSALASAGTILFMFWSLTLLGKRLVKAMRKDFTDARMWAVFASAAVGSLVYAFSDSFWFSAVEGEVYAMSSFFTALVFWAILRWDADDSPRADRWIVFIAYMMGLSVGVHLLNLLAIPAIVFIIYFKKYQPTNRGLIIAGLVSVGLLGVVQNGIIPGIVSAAANYELLFINTVGLPFNSGTIIYFMLLIGMIITGIMYSTRGTKQFFNYFAIAGGAFLFFSLIGAMLYGKAFMTFLTCCGAAGLVYYLRDKRILLNTIIMSFTVLLIGYSTFFVLVIRSQANTPMDENNPENAISLLSYLNREQYGDWPIAYGQYYNAPIDNQDHYHDGNPVYGQDTKSGEYVIVDSRKQSIPNFAPEMCTVFPRMWDNQRNHAEQYKFWGRVGSNHETVRLTNPQSGEEESFEKPTMGANLRYFFRYQIGWMYMRYFLWNFAGKQNDTQGHGNMTDGNWQSGFSKNKVEGIAVPKRMRDNPANNSFFYIPLLLGLIGLWFHFSRDFKSALVVMLMFLFTGLAIVIYLNQYPYQPRERDYAYAGSFYAFAFWVGFGVYALYDVLSSRAKVQQMVAAGLAGVMCLGSPLLMAQQGWDDHNRGNRYTARDFAKNYLTTCDENAVLFTNGDNDTFPLWYAQEVEDYRTDVRVLNLSLLNTDWYIDQANRKAYKSDRLPFSLPASRYRQGSCDQVLFDPQGKNKPAMSARALIDMIITGSKDAMEIRMNRDEDGESFPDTVFILPTNNVYIPVDKAKVKKNGTVPADTPDSLIVDRVEWKINKSYLLKADLMVLDLLASNNWERPIYFAVTAGSDAYLDLDNVSMDLNGDKKPERTSYLRLEGLAYRLVPMLARKTGMFNEPVICNTDLMYNKIMGNGTKETPGFQWGGLEIPGQKIYMDENNLRFTTNQRLQMMTLAKLLSDEGKFDKAKKVLDRCRAVMPREYVPYEPAMVYMVEGYYRSKDMASAKQVSDSLFTQCEEEYLFYTKIAEIDRDFSYDDDVNRNQSALRMLQQYAAQYGQKALADSYAKRLAALGLQVQPMRPPMDEESDLMNLGPDSNMTIDQLESLVGKKLNQPKDSVKKPK